MIVGNKKSLFPCLLHNIAYALVAVVAHIIRLIFIKLYKMPVVYRVAKLVMLAVPEGLGDVVGLNTNKADVAGFYEIKGSSLWLVYFHFKAVKCKKVFIVKVVVGD